MGIFKAYDVRGVYPDEVDASIARRIGRALVGFLDGPPDSLQIAVGRDMRESGIELAAAVREGIRASGATAVDIGMVTTPLLYHAVGANDLSAGIMVTASHNPAKYNGFKLCREEGIPIGSESGLQQIEAAATAADEPAMVDLLGGEERIDPLPPYVEHVARFAGPLAEEPSDPSKRLRVAFDCGNGAVGAIIDRVLTAMPGIEPHALYWEPDGSFPNHEANPLVIDNLRDVCALVREKKLDVGVAFDGDGDRMALVDETGEPLPSDRVTALLAREVLAKEPGAKIVYDLRSSWAVAEEIRAAGGEPVKERVGHAFIKATMREIGAPLGGELSGHFYFRDHFYCDSALIATALMLSLIARRGEPLSAIRAPLDRYAQSGETNFEVPDQDAALARLEEEFADGRIEHIDGVSVEYDDWWFNARKSNTEPILRLNVEARSAELLEKQLGRLRGLLA